jgi:tRNA threonylcarbamoyladenosine biosynthesis protein TsaB
MIVLGLDTATPSTVVGLRLEDGSVLQARDDPTGEERPGHATRLLPLASALLAEAGLGWRAVERVAVGVGPGTFTGLRIGVATARGIAQSLGVELVGVSSLRALAHTTHVVAKEQTVGVLAAIDARRGEMFVAAYDGELELVAPRALPPGEVRGLCEDELAHTGVDRWMAVGDGALRYRDAFEHCDVFVPGERATAHRIQAPAICELALGPTEPMCAGEVQVLPDYCRRPDAEIAYEQAAS